MSIRSPRLAALGLLGVLLTGGALSGCGVSDDQLRPGVAAQVGDTELGLDVIDDSVDVACSFFVDQQQVGFPRSLARQQFASVLVQRAAADQALEESGLAVGDDYEQGLSALDASNEQIPEDQRAPFALLSEATTFVDAAATLLGEEAFAAEGTVPADPIVLNDRGRSVIASWLDENDVAINPVFRLSVKDGQIVSAGTGTSVAASDFAVAGLLDPNTATETDVTASAAQLPAGQLCGAASPR
ncbi:hypothetical protein [Nocardioides sp.]|uniref:hypothetical protein n=1 Tax=Nocardioides sp. TaxID=35761 RepID=UPI002B2781E7|nr:hypothetical protein [Nocardioides sp.]